MTGRRPNKSDDEVDITYRNAINEIGISNLAAAIIAQAAKDVNNARFLNETKKFFESEWFKLLMWRYPNIDGSEVYNQIKENYKEKKSWKRKDFIYL